MTTPHALRPATELARRLAVLDTYRRHLRTQAAGAWKAHKRLLHAARWDKTYKPFLSETRRRAAGLSLAVAEVEDAMTRLVARIARGRPRQETDDGK